MYKYFLHGLICTRRYGVGWWLTYGKQCSQNEDLVAGHGVNDRWIYQSKLLENVRYVVFIPMRPVWGLWKVSVALVSHASHREAIKTLANVAVQNTDVLCGCWYVMFSCHSPSAAWQMTREASHRFLWINLIEDKEFIVHIPSGLIRSYQDMNKRTCWPPIQDLQVASDGS